jgi:hypothetical protein
VQAFASTPAQASGYLDWAGDVDLVGLQAGSAGTYRLLLEGSALDTKLRLLDADGNVVAASSHGAGAEQILAQLAPGRYVAEISAARAGDLDAKHDWRLQWRIS